MEDPQGRSASTVGLVAVFLAAMLGVRQAVGLGGGPATRADAFCSIEILGLRMPILISSKSRHVQVRGPLTGVEKSAVGSRHVTLPLE